MWFLILSTCVIAFIGTLLFLFSQQRRQLWDIFLKLRPMYWSSLVKSVPFLLPHLKITLEEASCLDGNKLLFITAQQLDLLMEKIPELLPYFDILIPSMHQLRPHLTFLLSEPVYIPMKYYSSTLAHRRHTPLIKEQGPDECKDAC